MNLNGGKTLAQLTKQLFEPLNLQRWMNATLHQQLRTTVIDKLLHLGKYLIVTEQIG